MRNIANGLSVTCAGLALLLLMFGCSKSADPPPAQGGFPPGPAPQASPVLAAAPAVPAATAPSSTLSPPNQFAPPCQSDGQCLTFRCNIAAGKCTIPCQTDNDCTPGSSCIAPTCLPKLQ